MVDIFISEFSDVKVERMLMQYFDLCEVTFLNARYFGQLVGVKYYQHSLLSSCELTYNTTNIAK